MFVAVDNGDSGKLDLFGGADLFSSATFLGFNPGSTGRVTLDDSGTTWTNTGQLLVGVAGTGSLFADDGGIVSNTNGVLGVSTGSTGTVTITEPGTTWINTGNLTVGDKGTGTLSITDSGTVYVGDNASDSPSIGMIVSDRTNTTGTGNSGHLFVQNASTLTNTGHAILGDDIAEFGYATVTGSGSTWTNTGNLTVGQFGIGTLNIQAGGDVTNSLGNVGIFSGSTGTTTVTGSGSTWTSTTNLFVGYSGTGTLNVETGGHVIVGDDLFMQNNGGTAFLNFTLGVSNPLIDVTDDATLGGTISVDVDPGRTLVDGQTFILIDIGGTRTGTFNNYAQDDLLGTFNGVDLFLTYFGGNGNDVVAYAVTATLVPGDTNGDGYVDNGDLAVVISNFTGPLGGAGGKDTSTGDADGDGDVTNSDLSLAISNFTGPPPTPAPEPTSLALLGVGALGLMRRRKA